MGCGAWAVVVVVVVVEGVVVVSEEGCVGCTLFVCVMDCFRSNSFCCLRALSIFLRQLTLAVMKYVINPIKATITVTTAMIKTHCKLALDVSVYESRGPLLVV